MKNERNVEDLVESILCEVDAKAGAKRMDMVMSSINELRKVTSRDPKIDKMVRQMEDMAKKISAEFNKRM